MKLREKQLHNVQTVRAIRRLCWAAVISAVGMAALAWVIGPWLFGVAGTVVMFLVVIIIGGFLFAYEDHDQDE